MNTEINQDPNSGIIDDKVPERRAFKLRSVENQTKLHTSFAEQFGFISDDGDAMIDAALDTLKSTFFRDNESKARTITNYHLTQVVTVAMKTGLNPFANDLYGLWTPFGELKVFATMEGWMKIASQSDITKREYIYSDTEVEVTISNNQYQVPKWIECIVEHKTKGVSTKREYFLEVFNNAQNHLPSWQRPARALAQVAFIQALRPMLDINCLSNSDMIVDMQREYEIAAVRAQADLMNTNDGQTDNNLSLSSRPTMSAVTTHNQSNRQLNVDLDKVEVIQFGKPQSVKQLAQTEEESSQAVVPAAKEADPEQTVDVHSSETEDEDLVPSEPMITESVNVDTPNVEAAKAISTEVDVAPEKATINSHENEVDELVVNRTILQIVKPFFEKFKNGAISVDKVISLRGMITDELGLRWFDQEVAKLKSL